MPCVFLLQVFCFVYLGLTVLSSMLLVLSMQEWGRVNPYINPPVDDNYTFWDLDEYHLEYLSENYGMNKNLLLIIMTEPHLALLILDFAVFTFFFFETVVHFAACPNKLRYMQDPYNVIKVTLIVCTATSYAFELKKSMVTTDTIATVFFVIKSISAARLLLIFRLRKIYRGLDIMLLALGSSLRELLLLGFAFSVFIVIYGIVIYAAEMESGKFESVYAGMWWALITMTTVGYGDFYPKTKLGYAIGAVCALNGLIVIALPIAAIASNFANYYCRYSDLENHQAETKCSKALPKLTAEHKVKIEELDK